MATKSLFQNQLNQKPATGLGTIPKSPLTPMQLEKLHAQGPGKVPEFAYLNSGRPMLERGKDIAPGLWPKILAAKGKKYG